MQTLKITKSAYEVMKKESLGCAAETGGHLIGPLREPIVVQVTTAGPAAKKSNASYTNDALYDNEILQQVITTYGGRVKSMGSWHKHPGKMSHPSLQDLHTAQEIVKRIEKSDNRPVYFIITNVAGNEVELFAYSLKHDQQTFDGISIKIIEDESEEIQNALNIEPVLIQPKKLDFWNDHDFQSPLTKVGNERLKLEIEDLTSQGYRVKVYTKDQFYLVIKKNETITCALPSEYPLNPPRIFNGNREMKYCMPIWNSTFRITDILDRLNKFKRLRGRSYESYRLKAKFNLLGFVKEVGLTFRHLWFHKKE